MARHSRLNRRELLGWAASAAAGAAAFRSITARANGPQPMADRLLFVITATGGANIVDSFMAVKASEAGTAAPGLIAYPDAFVTEDAATGLRALDLPDDHRAYFEGVTGNPFQQSMFLARHARHMAVLTQEGTSVNHLVAQKRALTGAGIFAGRTLGEMAAERYGQNLLLPQVNMASSGYLEPGSDPLLPAYARQEPVADARFFALGSDGMRGMAGAPAAAPNQAPRLEELGRTRALMARARAIRDQLDDASLFGQTFQCSTSRRRFLERRRDTNVRMEEQDLISKLFLLGGLEPFISPADFGLEASPEATAVRNAISPGLDVFNDRFLAQATLAFLLARHGISAAVTFGPPFAADGQTLAVNPPLSFDFSHFNHVATQAAMWSRILDVADKLIALLQQTPAGTGTMWDRSVIHIATDFGRDKERGMAGQDLREGLSTGHHLNNGSVILSPLIRPGLYGGVDPATLLTHGFLPATGQAAPHTVMREGHTFSAVAQALGITFPGQVPLPCLQV